MLAAIIASLSLALTTITDKVNLSRKKLAVATFIPALFILMFALNGLFVPRYGWLRADLIFQPKYILLFLGMIVSAFIWNYFFYRSLQQEEMQEFAIIEVFSPLAIIMLATIFLPAERNWLDFGFAILAIIILMAVHLRPHHLKLENYTKYHAIEITFIAVEAILIKELLTAYSPFMLFFVRTGIVAIMMLFIFRPKYTDLVKNQHWLFLILSVIFSTGYMVARFYGFAKVGVVETTLFLIVTPILVYLLDALILKEKLKPRYLLAAAGILVLLVITQIV